MTKIFASAALLPQGLASDVTIEVEAGRIARISAGSTSKGADEVHDVVMPGVGNLHSHAFQRAMAGLAERRGNDADSFWSWRSVMYKFALSMTPEDVEAVAAQLYVEMLEAGFTRVGEFHYLHHDVSGAPYANVAEMAERIAAASVGTGIGLTLLPVFYAHPGFGPKPPSDDQRRFINDLDRFAALMSASRSIVDGIDGGRLGIAPHSLRAATIDEVRDVVALSHDGPIHIHVAEQQAEVDACLELMGARPVELLLSAVSVNDRWCLIHATHMTESELRAVAASGAVVGLCPITEANLGDGVFRAREYRDASGAFGVGSDSNIGVSLAGELRQLEYSQRLVHQARNVLAPPGGSTGEALLLGAHAGGSRALGVEAVLAEGMPADLVSLDIGEAAYLRGDAVLDAFVFGRGVAVKDVWVAGRKLVAGGRHHSRTQIRARFAKTMTRLLQA
ncbi:MAG: formimidoylglutamate deiminase [Devosia sp.]|nr:formimidoylglutamate deiminase [Devosia sp.]